MRNTVSKSSSKFQIYMGVQYLGHVLCGLASSAETEWENFSTDIFLGTYITSVLSVAIFLTKLLILPFEF